MIYRYMPDYDKFDCFVADNEAERAINSVRGEAVGIAWEPPVLEVEDIGESGDFPGVTGCQLPLFSQRAWERLSPDLAPHVEHLPVSTGAGEFLFINPLTVLDCLDPSKSVFSRFRDGTISQIDRPVFQPTFSPPCSMFRVVQYPRHVYVTEAFREATKRHRLRGLYWVPV